MRYISLFFLILLFSCDQNRSRSNSLLDYIPEHNSVLIKVHGLAAFQNALKNNDFLKNQESSTLNEMILTKIQDLDFFQSSTQGLLTFSRTADSIPAFFYVTQDSLYLFNEDAESKKETITFNSRNYDAYIKGIDTVYSLTHNNALVLSSSKALIEEAIFKNKKPISEKLLRLYTISQSKRNSTLFIDPQKENPMITSLAKDELLGIPSFFSDWISLDISLSQKELNLNGVSTSVDSLKSYASLFKNTTPLVNTTPSFAPIQADAVLSYTFDQYDVFLKNQETYLENSTVLDSTFNTVEEIGSIYVKEKKAIVLNTYGSERISTYLERIKKASSFYQGNEIIDLNYADFLNVYFNPLIQGFKAEHYTVLENAFIFSADVEVLRMIISNYKNGTTFDKGPLFETTKGVMADEATVLFISNQNGITETLKSDFSSPFLKSLKKRSDAYTFAAQMVADQNFYHTHLLAKQSEKESQINTTSPIFTLQIDDELATAPQFVINHNNKTKEIVVQDVQNNLYLISAQGKVLWKKKLKGSIQGKIAQVDLYKNGRLQLAFTTETQFLVLDRNGREVSGFKKSFKDGGLNPLAVFDYDKNRNYRFVITQGNKVMMYDRRGKTVNGFTYTTAESPVINIPKHFRIGTRDYLVFQLENGQFKILDRVGRTRVKVSENINFSNNSAYVYKNKFTVTDDEGVLIQIDSRGRMSQTKLNLNRDHGMDATSKTLVHLNDNILSIKGKKLTLDFGVYTKPKIFYLNTKIYVSLVDIQNQKVYLFDSNAALLQNFPVYGNSEIDLADIDKDGKLELVTKNEDNSVIVYRMN
ncbi:ribonuclease HII [Spongiimicrobium salis]|uniref:ribonuclease HII n=1 Tax=Spongiimicrobium salis TaxID=1667022 RepID=UPI00374D8024